MTEDASQPLEARIRPYIGVTIGPIEVAQDAVNEPMIRHWCQAMGDANPAYTDPGKAKASVHGGIVAPPTMLQAWILPGYEMAQPAQGSLNKQQELHAIFNELGYTGVVATNCDQVYDRYLKPGDRVSATTVIESISPEKATGLGTGRFIETRTTFTDQDGKRVGEMMFRVLKFKPAQQPQAAAETAKAAPAKPARIPPVLGHDNQWWWDAVRSGELRIQRCTSCGTLRHPPRPMCGECQSLEWDTVQASGRGTVNSFVVVHYPPVPGYDLPLAVALVDLEEGTRLVANVAGCKPSEVRIGMRVECRIEKVDEKTTLPVFHPVK
jgi:uncharacterized OB-fold protein/acyl dehydratase